MRMKDTRGFTVMELVISISLLSLLALGIGMIISSAYNNHTINERIQKDEANARFALLFITREAHKGVESAEVTDSDGDGKTDLLVLTMWNGEERLGYKEASFFLAEENGTKYLRCTQDGVDTGLLESVELADFEPGKTDINGKEFLNIAIECRHGFKLSSTVSISRAYNMLPDPPENP